MNNNLKDLNNYFNPNGDTQNPIIDPLARSTNQNNNTSALPARRWELAAIAPDLFDITYYSIFPSYMHTHYRYVKQLSEEEVPGDLGFSFNASPTNYNHLRYQAHIGQGGVWQILGLNSPPFYKITRPSLFLTGWNPLKANIFLISLVFILLHIV